MTSGGMKRGVPSNERRARMWTCSFLCTRLAGRAVGGGGGGEERGEEGGKEGRRGGGRGREEIKCGNFVRKDDDYGEL